MTKYVSSRFEDVNIELDGNHFENCNFLNCVIVYKGMSPFNLIGCSFSGCKWKFDGPASNTIHFLKTMYKDMGPFGRQMVEATFENIKK